MPVELRGSVVLRDFRREDRDDFMALVHDDAMFTFMKFRLDEESARDLFDYFVGEPTAKPRRHWNLVVETPEGTFAGWSGIDARRAEDEAEIGWYLTSQHWGRGYATEATRLLIDFAFGPLALHRLFAMADPDNAASRRVLEKSEFRLLGPVGDVQTWRGPRRRVAYEFLQGPT